MSKFHIVLYRATYLQRLSEVETAIKTDFSFRDPQISLNTIRLIKTAKEIGMNGAECTKLWKSLRLEKGTKCESELT